jgi:carbonic anhydrase/acetyltransferase-like protein (isoleucine patch superfamily)
MGRKTNLKKSSVGDEAAVSGQAALQTHLFEDRVMKMSTVTLESGCTVGARAVVLYDATIGADAELEALSLAMKGECLHGGNWQGIPARMQKWQHLDHFTSDTHTISLSFRA